jgi:hypothetical protein
MRVTRIETVKLTVARSAKLNMASTDPSVTRLWHQLEEEEKKVVLERKRLQEIWQKIAQMHSVNEAKRAA